MGSATIGYPFGIIAHSHVKFGVSPQKIEFSGSNIPLHVEFSRINLYTSSASIATSKGLVSRICCLPNIGNDDFSEKPPTPILDLVENPVNLKNLSIEDLNQLAAEIRAELAYVMSKLQIYFKASLAVVELTVAMHHVFNAPVDKILWEVGQQTYAHKILTGRRSLLHTIQQMDGLSGFTSRAESEYDPFGSGHGCNSISAGLGMAIARDIKGKRERIVTVISNGTTMAGQIYEAMNNAGHLDSNLIVILNDSRHTLHPRSDEGPKTSVNALSGTLTRIQSNRSFRKLREVAKGVTKRIGMGMHEWAAKVDEYARGMIGPLGSTLFEELGLYYIGPVDGNNIEDLVSVLREVASLDTLGPVLVHVITEENYGPETKTNQKNEIVNKQYEGSSTSNGFPSETNQNNEIAIKQYEGSSTSNGFSSELRYRTFTDCFVEALVMEANKDRDIVIVHAGMHMEKSLQLLHERFPTKFFDVGMAEQHAVTFSAGLSCGGLKPFCIIPSAFLQRAYDQVVHDVDQQKIPVRFVIPSAGLVGSDGPTECGAFDITFMSCLPNMIVMAPSDDVELVNMVATAACVDDRPICFRYPRGVVVGIDHKISSGIPIEIGKGKVIVEGDDVALLGYGAMVQNCLKAHSLLANLGINVTVADARFCKPLDIKLLRELCENHSFLITVEEGSLGGFGSHVAQFIALDGRLDGRVKWRPIVLPDHYIKHGTPDEQLSLAGLSGHHIAATALSLLGRPREALLLMR